MNISWDYAEITKETFNFYYAKAFNRTEFENTVHLDICEFPFAMFQEDPGGLDQRINVEFSNTQWENSLDYLPETIGRGRMYFYRLI